MAGYMYINLGELKRAIDEEVGMLNEINEQLTLMKDRAVGIEKSWEGVAKNQFIYMLRIEIANLEEQVSKAKKLVTGMYEMGLAASRTCRCVTEKIEGGFYEG